MSEKQTRQEIERIAEIKIRNARTAIMTSRKFYAVLVANVTPKPCWEIPTMGTDSVTHFYNPGFIAGLPQKIVEGVQAHESEHDARHHSTRRKGRNPVRWNKACDYSINGDLFAEGFELPEGVLFRKDFVGMASEDIYRVLEVEEMQEAEKQQEQEQDSDDGDDQEQSESGDDDTDQDSDGSESGDESDDDESGDDEGTDGESDGEEGDDESDQDGGGGETGDDGEAADDSDGSGDGEAEGEADGASDGEGQGQGDGQGDPVPSSCGDAGGCGEVFDAPGDEAERADTDAKWEVITHQANAIARKHGDVPGHWQTIIEQRKTPTQDWRTVLRQYIDAGARMIQSWNRPNRRFVGAGTILPSNQRDGVNKIVFIVDTSGSMVWRGDALNKVANEVQAAMDDGAVSESIVIYNDAQVNRVDRYIDGDRIEFDPLGGGGTDMKPSFDWAAANEPDASLIVCLTDLEIGEAGDEPAVPVLWCAYNDPRMIAALTPPWGEVLDVGFGSDVGWN
jgi:predicted metal-dependent peptidase